MADPQYLPESPLGSDWDILTLDDKQWPGLARVECERSNKWQDKKSKAAHGGERDFNGADNGKIQITIKVWKKADYDSLVKDFLPSIEPVPGKKTAPTLKIDHPVTRARNVPTITIDKIKGPNAGEGSTTFEIDATEQRKIETANAFGSAGGKGFGGGKKPVLQGANCGQLAAQLQKEQEKRAVANKLLNQKQAQLTKAETDQANGEIMSPGYSVNMDAIRAERDGYQAQVAESNANINAIQQQQVKNNCGNSDPSANGAGGP